MRSGTNLYDKLHISHDGYAGAVPIVHKSAAVSEVIAQLAIEADDDPEWARPAPGRNLSWRRFRFPSLDLRVPEFDYRPCGYHARKVWYPPGRFRTLNPCCLRSRSA